MRDFNPRTLEWRSSSLALGQSRVAPARGIQPLWWASKTRVLALNDAGKTYFVNFASSRRGTATPELGCAQFHCIASFDSMVLASMDTEVVGVFNGGANGTVVTAVAAVRLKMYVYDA